MFATLSTPSGMRPVYRQPNVAAGRGRHRKRPGARDGHPGRHRPSPTRIDERQTHRLKVCPCCGGPLQRCPRRRTRIIEDLPADLHAVVTEHTIHRDYCPTCKKDVEPVVPDALPNATFGHRLIRFTSWCHYGLGVTLDLLIDILPFHLRTKLSAGGLIAAGQRLATILTPWYEQLARQARDSACRHADETGGRVPGQTCCGVLPTGRSATTWSTAVAAVPFSSNASATRLTASCCTTSGPRTSPSTWPIGSMASCLCGASWSRSPRTIPRRNGGPSPSCGGV